MTDMVSLDTANDEQCVNFTIVDDNMPEGTEFFTVSLQLPAGPQFQLGTIATATVQILDNGMSLEYISNSSFKNHLPNHYSSIL